MVDTANDYKQVINAPKTQELYSAHIPALQVLMVMGYDYLSPEEALQRRGGKTTGLLLRDVVEELKTQHFEYKVQSYRLPPNACDFHKIRPLIRYTGSAGRSLGRFTADWRRIRSEFSTDICRFQAMTEMKFSREIYDGTSGTSRIPMMFSNVYWRIILIVTAEFSDYLVFVDESGDHGLQAIDPQFPVFALVFCIIHKAEYLQSIVPEFQRLKMEFWGHDQIIFHEHDIRKEKNHFGLLRTDKALREAFFERISGIIENAPFQLIASVIDKNKLLERYNNPYNPYEIALLFCMERLLGFLLQQGQKSRKVHLLIESRGQRENDELELEFRRICDNRGNWGYKSMDFQAMTFEHCFVDKKSNSTGLQLADLVARPLALKYLRPDQQNRTRQIIEAKLLNVKQFP